jgi:diadenosine tetraphosphate (Ap4A) HIT family hydrolase
MRMKKENKKELEEKEEYQTGFFQDGLNVFLSYTERRLEENPDYQPHPILRAFNAGLTKFDELKIGERTIGLSGNDGQQVVGVVLEKMGDHVKVLNIIDFHTDESIPVELIFRLFRLQRKIDKYPDGIPTKEMVDAMDAIFPEFHFHYLGDRWVQARDHMKKLMQEGKIRLPAGNQQLVNDLKLITYEMKWEDYPPSVRSMIGVVAHDMFEDKRPSAVVISTPPGVNNDPRKVFDSVMQYYLGESARYFGLKDCLFCGKGDDTLELMSFWDHHVLVANKYPNVANQLLIVPKVHTRAVCDLPENQILEAEDLLEAVEQFYSKIGVKEYTVIESGFVLQSVFHSHIHIIPLEIDIEKDLEIKLSHKTEIGSFVDGVDFYKKHGSYIIFKNKDGIFIAKPEVEDGDKRSISQLVDDSLMWQEKLSDKEYLKNE